MLSELRHIPNELRAVLRALPRGFHIVKKRDHYFLFDGDTRICCVSNNSSPSKRSGFITKQVIHSIQNYMKRRTACNS